MPSYCYEACENSFYQLEGKMAKITRRDRSILNMLERERSVSYIAGDLRISESEVDSAMKRLKKHGMLPLKKKQ